MGIIKKFIIQVHADGFGWQEFESSAEPSIEGGWLNIRLPNGNCCFQLDRVSQYTIRYELEE